MPNCRWTAIRRQSHRSPLARCRRTWAVLRDLLRRALEPRILLSTTLEAIPGEPRPQRPRASSQSYPKPLPAWLKLHASLYLTHRSAPHKRHPLPPLSDGAASSTRVPPLDVPQFDPSRRKIKNNGAEYWRSLSPKSQLINSGLCPFRINPK